MLLQVQAGVNLNYKQAIANDFVIGGLNQVVRNQITFAGLPEAGLLTSSALVGLVGYQYSLGPRVYGAAKANLLYHDFITSNTRRQGTSFHYGSAVSVGVNSFLGPIEASLMYSDLAQKLLPYFNIGILFGYR